MRTAGGAERRDGERKELKRGAARLPVLVCGGPGDFDRQFLRPLGRLARVLAVAALQNDFLVFLVLLALLDFRGGGRRRARECAGGDESNRLNERESKDRQEPEPEEFLHGSPVTKRDRRNHTQIVRVWASSSS